MIISSVARITVVVAEITFKVAMIISSVAKITFVIAEITFKVALITSLLAKINFVVAEITYKVSMITSLMAKITCVVADIKLKVAVITYSVVKITFEKIARENAKVITKIYNCILYKVTMSGKSCWNSLKTLDIVSALLYISYSTEIKYYVSTFKPLIVTFN